MKLEWRDAPDDSSVKLADYVGLGGRQFAVSANCFGFDVVCGDYEYVLSVGPHDGDPPADHSAALCAVMQRAEIVLNVFTGFVRVSELDLARLAQVVARDSKVAP